MLKSLPENPTSAMTLAIVVAALVATGTMFVPATALEAITGPTGLSELIPAVAAPMSDVARAMIAYAAGAMTLGGLTVMLCWPDRSHAAAYRTEAEPGNAARLGSDILRFLATKLTWAQKADGIHNLADLAQFQGAKTNPDTAVRLPLLASRDLPDVGMSRPDSADSCRTEKFAERGLAFSHMPMTEAVPDAMSEPSTMELVGQFEAAVAQRHQKLADIEAAASCGSLQVTEADANAVHVPQNQNDAHQVVEDDDRRPVLELVASNSASDVDADSALAAALATLHRMTANAR